MPYLNIKLSGEPSPRLSEEVAQSLTRITADLLGKKSEVTAVVVEPIPLHSWFTGGMPLASTGRSSFYLDIKITEGTNTKQEKASYISHIFAAMQDLLGAIDEASYIVIHDVRADSWGYQGVTQEYRFVAASNSTGGTV